MSSIIEAKLLRVYIEELDKIHGKPLYEQIVMEAKNRNLAGASVFKGILSYGSASLIHSQKMLALSSDMPILIEIIDEVSKINDFIPILNQMFEKAECGGIITLENLEVIKYTAGSKR
ncbi:DUF190 domain-containing protein [Candidatus Kapaibacterium sp.]